MADGVRTPRSRGSLCGLALVVLGGWGGLAPFAGPSFGYGFTPKAWTYTQGRLYLSALPGAVVLVAGLIILATRSRAFGGFCAFIAALGGGWFIAGAALVRLLPASQAAAIKTGAPLGTGTSRLVLTSLTFYAGVGALIVFFAALALGRFSIAAHKDHDGLASDLGDAAGLAAAGALGYGGYLAGRGTAAYSPSQPQFLPGQTQGIPAQSQYPSQYPAGQDAFPPDQYQTTPEQYPPHDPFGLTQEAYPTSQPPFPAAPNPYAPAHDATVAAPEHPHGQQNPAPPAS